ncbi:unnamed protein product [Lota lota]
MIRRASEQQAGVSAVTFEKRHKRMVPHGKVRHTNPTVVQRLCIETATCMTIKRHVAVTVTRQRLNEGVPLAVSANQVQEQRAVTAKCCRREGTAAETRACGS